MLPLIAVPLIHSSGAWIASTAAGGYVAGTLSTTWVGAFIAGNAGILTGLGLTSGAGVLAAMGGGLSGIGAALGSGLSAVGLGGVAQTLGLAPATFLGLTVVGWAAAVASVATLGAGYFFTRAKLREINEERAKGGLGEITWGGIIDEVRAFDHEAMVAILIELERETTDIVVDVETDTVFIYNEAYSIRDLEYVIEKSGKEYIGLKSRIPFCGKELYQIKPADD